MIEKDLTNQSLTKRYYSLVDSDSKILLKVLEIDFIGESPLNDKIAKPQLIRKIVLSLNLWRGTLPISLEIKDNSIDSFFIIATFDTEDGSFENEFDLRIVEII